MSQTHILGKDAALEDSILSMQQKLHTLDFNIIEKSWLNPIANVWSVHICDRDCPLLFTNGKGASKKAALASALGEFFERLACNYFWADFYLGDEQSQADFVHYPNEKWFPFRDDTIPDGMLSSSLWDFYNDEQTLLASNLVDLNANNPKRGICTLPYQRQRDGETIYFPVNIIGNLYVSNGMSAGNSVAEARVQALSEIFERAIKFKIIGEGICLPDIPDEVLQRYPSIQSGIVALQQAGYGVLIKDASLGGQYPVICVTLLNPEDQGCYASFGAHPRFEVALERALTELLQGRALDALAGFSAPGFDLDEIASLQNLETHFIDSSGIIPWDFLAPTADYDFNDWDFTGTTAEEFNSLCDKIHADDLDIYIADYQHLGVYACRIIIPKMSEIYPPDDLIWANNNAGMDLRESLINLDDSAKAQAELLEQLNQRDLEEQQPVATLIGLAPDKNSLWFDLRIAELKTLLALKSGDHEQALEGCQWLIYFAQLNPERLKTYRCVDVLLQFKLNKDEGEYQQYHQSLKQLFGKLYLQQAEALLQGKTVFSLQKAWKMHQKLITAYQKIHI
ncbi:MAG: YcaO-like family protein [Cocleimonas sp.]|nr:YcaO-like family protein [Cocleimonas sp.]